ncbi:MAG: HlyD family efflux transporter periplasmic adaptor subunit [Asticcacaulis sp.]
MRAGLSALNLTAPATGRLTDFDLKPGQAVKQGDPIAEVDSEGTWKLRADVDEYYLARLSPAWPPPPMSTARTCRCISARSFRRSATAMSPSSWNSTRCRPTSSAAKSFDVRLSLGATQEATLVPAGSWLSDSNGTSIFVLNAAGTKADRRTVTVGRRNPEYAEILAGLKPGEHVITGGTSNYVKAQHLRFNKSTQP